MKKKTTRKLTLNHETLRPLAETELGKGPVQGGAWNTYDYGCYESLMVSICVSCQPMD